MKAFLHCSLSLLTLLLVSAQIRTWDRWGYYGLSSPMRFLEQAGEQYDTVILGSSHLTRGFDPAALDEVTAELGTPTRSFNASRPGALSHELNVMLRDLLAYMPQPPKRIIVEVMAWNPRVVDENKMSSRALLWHTWRELWAIFDSMHLHMPGETESTTAESLARGWDHVAHLIRNTFRVGCGPRIVATLFDEPLGKNQRSRFVSRRGFNPYDMANKTHAKRAKRFTKDRAARFRATALRMAEDVPEPRRHEPNWPAIEQQIALVASYGVELIYMIAPVPNPRLNIEDRAKLRDLATVLDFSDPRDYPELYDPKERFDASHFNALGADRFSRVVGRDLHALLTEPRKGQGK